MPFSLIPDRLYGRYSDLSPEVLRAMGVDLLLCDLDYTLAPKSVRRPDDALRRWTASLREAGIQIMIVSNNRSGRRVREFCGDLGVPYQGHAQKPLTRGLRAAMSRAGVGPERTAMLGDKLLTDVLSAKRAGILALMVDPAGGARGPWQKILHALQDPFKAVCRRRGGG